MLLVIALITAISVSGIHFYRQRTLGIKIDKTALQMQQWLQAGQLFYGRVGRWPTQADREVLLNTYLPTNSDTNPWGKNYEIQAVTDHNNQLNGNLFRVATEIPFTASSTVTRSPTAERIAGLLPNANVTDPATVYSEVTIPGTGNGLPGGVTIVSIESRDLHGGITAKNVDESISVNKPSETVCPRATHTVKLYYAYSGMELNEGNNTKFTERLGKSYVSLGGEDGSDDAWTIDMRTEAYRPKNYSNKDTYVNHNGRLLLITTCEAKALPVMPSVHARGFLF